AAPPHPRRSGGEVQRELVRMRPEPDGVDLVRHLVVDPGLDDVLGEDVALQEEIVVALQVLERFVVRAPRISATSFSPWGVGRLVSLSSGCRGSSRRSMPSRPAMSMAAKAMYPLQAGAGDRPSIASASGDGAD